MSTLRFQPNTAASSMICRDRAQARGRQLRLAAADLPVQQWMAGQSSRRCSRHVSHLNAARLSRAGHEEVRRRGDGDLFDRIDDPHRQTRKLHRLRATRRPVDAVTMMSVDDCVMIWPSLPHYARRRPPRYHRRWHHANNSAELRNRRGQAWRACFVDVTHCQQ